ncbi:MAG: DUF4982 domain-containing protein, partial [Tannerellaceae bacterium]|nr:DUF4982 domain-containing protein [Tannerellaceae bacterium]
MKKAANQYMRKRISSVIGLFILIHLAMYSCTPIQNNDSLSRDMSFNTGWKFIRDSVTGAELPEFDDSDWLSVDLPHDFSLMDLPGCDTSAYTGPFSKNSPGNGNATGHFMGGTGWYRKSFKLDKADKGKTVILKFDGVYMETEIWINGKKTGIHRNGYTPFWFDITEFLLEPSRANVIAVKVTNAGRNSRWYSGSGIYRNVRLTVSEPVHVSPWGVCITTSGITPHAATAHIEVTVRNDSDKETNTQISIHIKDANGDTVGSSSGKITLSANSEKIANQQIKINNPDLWSIETPRLYTAEVIIESDNRIMDKRIRKFGIRSIEFSADKGFLLNGTPVLLKGGCVHHDNGLLGATAFNRAEIRKVELLKSYGFNAVRFSHNPPSDVFLDGCDSLGVLVINEFTDMWEQYKNPQDYSRFFREWWNKDLTDMILRDRNHPSIIMWSIGNEIYEPESSVRIQTGKRLAERVRELDHTRPVTTAVTGFFYPDGWETTAPVFDLVDVCGYNYSLEHVESDHQLHPARIMYSSESYPKDAWDYWKIAEKNSYVTGDFVWTAWDYLGEAGTGGTSYVPSSTEITIAGNFSGFTLPKGVNIFDLQARRPSVWPVYLAGCGDIDITGEKRAQLIYRNVLWDNSQIEVCVHEPIPAGFAEDMGGWGWPREYQSWNWKGNENRPLKIRVFTKAPHVRLELNGKIVGEKDLTAEDKDIAAFEAPYQPGELRAIAMENGKELAASVLKTTGEPAAIRLTAERNIIKADRNDLAYIKIEVVDENGELLPQASHLIQLKIEGDGELIASGNADPKDMESFNRPDIKAHNGKAQAIVRPFSIPGRIKVTAESEGLIAGEAII